MESLPPKKVMAYAFVKSFIDGLDRPSYSSKSAILQFAAQLASLYEIADGGKRNFSAFISRGRITDYDDLEISVVGKTKRYQEKLGKIDILDMDFFKLTNKTQLEEIVAQAIKDSAGHYSLNTVLAIWHDIDFLHNLEYILAVKYKDFILYSTVGFIDPHEKMMSLHMRDIFPEARVKKNRNAVMDSYHDLQKMSTSFSLVTELNGILRTNRDIGNIKKPVDISNFN